MTNALKFTLLKNSIESLSTNDVTSNLLIDTYYYIITLYWKSKENTVFLKAKLCLKNIKWPTLSN